MFGSLDLGSRDRVHLTPMEFPGPRSKRSHAEVDDCDECLPISKRINRLRIEAQRKSHGDERCDPSLQMNGHAVTGEPQLSASWQSDISHNSSALSAPSHSPGGFTNGHGFSPPGYPTSSSSASCSVCGILPHGILCPHMSPSAQQTVNLTNSNNIPDQQYSDQFSQGAMAMSHQFLHNGQFVPQGPEAGPYYESDTQGQAMDEEYDPELTETENPYYFHINEVLFNAHCQRLRRTTTHPRPDGSQ